MTFELRDYEKFEKVSGKWRVIKNKGGEVSIEFKYLNKIATGTLRESIFYFSYPKDFYSGKFEHLLYVKTTKKSRQMNPRSKKVKANKP
ncbi:hypothetical protein RCC89_15015 [Cytophagaceae bacterium ABcell3]|nr:hypothetical protein RCC89_15015 [Cytophagaceae bacterium ABcell3]